MQPTKNRGFTLIELLVVIAIVGILAGVVTSSFSGIRKQSRANTAKADVEAMAADIQTYMSSHINVTPIKTEVITAGVVPGTAWNTYWTSAVGKQTAYKAPSGSDITYQVQVVGKKYVTCAFSPDGGDMPAVLDGSKRYWIAKDGEFYAGDSCPTL